MSDDGLFKQYQDRGYCSIQRVVDDEALDELRAATSRCVRNAEDPGRVLEQDGQTVRGLHGTHLHDQTFAMLCRHPVLLGAAEKLLGEQVYVHQFKLNIKAAFIGDVWDWHQDMTFYHYEDELPQPEFLTVALYLDDVTEFNGPLTVIPRSHKEGLLPSAKRQIVEYDTKSDWLSNTTAKLRYTADHDTLRRLVRMYGLDAPKGRAGDAVIFHANLFHGSGVNISPFDRRVVFISYNSVKNLPRRTRPPRPEFLAARNFEPLTPCIDALV
jgi:ectoine hydroxylase